MLLQALGIQNKAKYTLYLNSTYTTQWLHRVYTVQYYNKSGASTAREIL